MLILLLFYICKTLLYEIQHKNKSQNISYMIKKISFEITYSFCVKCEYSA